LTESPSRIITADYYLPPAGFEGEIGKHFGVLIVAKHELGQHHSTLRSDDNRIVFKHLCPTNVEKMHAIFQNGTRGESSDSLPVALQKAYRAKIVTPQSRPSLHDPQQE
jgi:hypothetical protein